MSVSPRIGKIAYAAFFTVVLPLGLWFWSSRLSCPFPAVHSPRLGAGLCAGGAVLMLVAMWKLWREGGGLPMNAFPPPRIVLTGLYSLLPHPIYCGFIACCAGAALLSGSAAGLWIVTPIAALGCLALVLGYEGPDLRRRFDGALPAPWLGLPSGEGSLCPRCRVGAALAVLLPWMICFAAIKSLGVPAGAFESRLGWEWTLPVWPATVALYASLYLVVPLTFLSCADRAQMRLLVVGGWLATALCALLYLTVPATATFRTVPACDGWSVWLAWEQRLAAPAAGSLPSSHVAWAVLCAGCLARGPLRRARALCWLWCLGLGVSCLATAMHSLGDVVAGALVGVLCLGPDKLWRWMLDRTERLGNSWKAWLVGPIRVINHGLWSGLAGVAVVFIAGWSAGMENLGWIFSVAGCALVGAGLWAQWVEGSSALLRPFGYYGAILGGLLAMGIVALIRGPATDLLAAFALAAPWTQAIGRMRCVIQGCCHGRPVAWGIRITCPHSRVVKLAGFGGQGIHPAPLYSILTNIVIGAVLWRLRIAGAGAFLLAGVYLLLAGLSRFVEEAYRGEPQTLRFGGLPLYQWMAIGSLLLGMVAMTLPGAPLPPLHAPSAWLLASSSLWGLVCAFAMSVDFPASNRRFSRLTG
jgi:membrane-associated phospholipid phosphatase/protein-S-isoprenylcysteine O-methyltransferase Ste14